VSFVPFGTKNAKARARASCLHRGPPFVFAWSVSVARRYPVCPEGTIAHSPRFQPWGYGARAMSPEGTAEGLVQQEPSWWGILCFISTVRNHSSNELRGELFLVITEHLTGAEDPQSAHHSSRPFGTYRRCIVDPRLKPWAFFIRPFRDGKQCQTPGRSIILHRGQPFAFAGSVIFRGQASIPNVPKYQPHATVVAGFVAHFRIAKGHDLP